MSNWVHTHLQGGGPVLLNLNFARSIQPIEGGSEVIFPKAFGELGSEVMRVAVTADFIQLSAILVFKGALTAAEIEPGAKST